MSLVFFYVWENASVQAWNHSFDVHLNSWGPISSFLQSEFTWAAAMADSFMASQGAQQLQNLPASAGDPRDMGSIPGSGR